MRFDPPIRVCILYTYSETPDLSFQHPDEILGVFLEIWDSRCVEEWEASIRNDLPPAYTIKIRKYAERFTVNREDYLRLQEAMR